MRVGLVWVPTATSSRTKAHIVRDGGHGDRKPYCHADVTWPGEYNFWIVYEGESSAFCRKCLAAYKRYLRSRGTVLEEGRNGN